MRSSHVTGVLKIALLTWVTFWLSMSGLMILFSTEPLAYALLNTGIGVLVLILGLPVLRWKEVELSDNQLRISNFGKVVQVPLVSIESVDRARHRDQ